MKKTLKAAVAATLMVGSAQAARADLTLNGAVGLPLNPTAQIPLQGGARVQADYFKIADDAKFYGLHGATRLGGTIELNGGIERLDSSDNPGIEKTGIALGAKYLFSRESDPTGVRLAVGAGYSRALLNNVHVYVVGTKYLGAVTGERVPIVAHLGLRYDRFKIPNGGDRSNRASIYGGVEVPLTRTGQFSAVGELQSKNNEFGGAKIPYSASLRYRPPGQGFSANVGFARQGLTNKSGLFLQIGYSFARGNIDSDMSGTTNGQ